MTDNAPKAKVAWILGAGFSRPLGGPLLNDLFSAAMQQRVGALDGAEWGDLVSGFKQVREIFHPSNHNGLRMDDPAWPEPWRDAEEFLDYVDAAAEAARSGENSLVFEKIVAALRLKNKQAYNNDVAQFAWRVRYLLGLQCCLFLGGANTVGEKWSPYRSWVERLGAGDRVLTFNYDMVLELLSGMDAEAFNRDTSHVFDPKILVRAPENWFKDASRLTRQFMVDGSAAAQQKAVAYKLHGSTNWVWYEGADGATNWSISAHGSSINALMKRKGNDHLQAKLAIAGPGPGKRNSCVEWFKGIWDEGIAAVREAQKVVFLGYRFPETDAYAREQIIGALRKNENPELEVHVVLGPDMQRPDVQRMVGMLQFARGLWKPYVFLGTNSIAPGLTPGEKNKRMRMGIGGRYGEKALGAIRVHPLWVQDYLSLIGKPNGEWVL